MVGKVIKEHLKKLNLSQKELSIRTNLAEQTLSEIITEKRIANLQTLLKIERALGLPQLLLIGLKIKNEKHKIRKSDKGLATIVDFLEKQDEYKLYEKESLIEIAAKLIGSDKVVARKKEFEFVSEGFRKYKDKPLAYLWIAILEKKYSNLKSKGIFKKSSGKTIIKGTLDIMISKLDFQKRVTNLKTFLDKHGIVLINAPFIPNSTINGATFKRNHQRFIFMNDMKKREHQYIFCLIHELLHYYENNFDDDDKKVANIIREYLKKYKKNHWALELAMETYEDKTRATKEKWNALYEKTKSQRINFGEVSDLIKIEKSRYN